MSLKKNLLIDFTAFVALLLSMEPRLTGIAVHEWLCLAFAGLLIVHLLIHWDWVINTSKRFFKNVVSPSRLRYVLDALIFAGITVVMLSGLMISESVLSLFGLGREAGEELRLGMAGGMPGFNGVQGGFGGSFPGGFGDGMGPGGNFSWRRIHDLSANITVLLVAFHVALNWEWVKNTFRRWLKAPLTRRQNAGAPVTAQLAVISVNNEQNRGADA